ncbi:hypothetical protein DB35_10940 [Streptomyces abyssalis]|uniref:Gliding motility protein n=1 Tax=Streptomyces abyssalis TaxID=933944 RepID=A0A1E7JHQ4_9ACTN|nr:hypothetical protein [Streptomyces abyssalis]OEU85993.1 hypothetical protein AN215_26960 [Streptomyces abyssalis]OEU92539.1 hypothetical protein DB35_10940 [Streptomyces abyssalis]OEV30992.1 hypothetical protein AN219_07595 [Streptomyces nanshensis]
MGVFARLLRRSSGSPRKPAAGAAPAAEAGAGEKAKEEEVGAAGAGDESEDVGIPKQQSADGAADSEAADDARN